MLIIGIGIRLQGQVRLLEVSNYEFPIVSLRKILIFCEEVLGELLTESRTFQKARERLRTFERVVHPDRTHPVRRATKEVVNHGFTGEAMDLSAAEFL